MPINGVANHILHLDKGRASGFDRLFRKHPGELRLGQGLGAAQECSHPIYIADPTSGALRGLVCAGYNFAHPDALPLSYVATLWPMLTRVISMDRGEAYPRGVEYPMIDPVSVEEPHG
jgi:hypothetical protein